MEEEGLSTSAAATREQDGTLAAPARMSEEILKLEKLTKDLLDTISTSSEPLGKRKGSGADIQLLVRKILAQNAETSKLKHEVEVHQARQQVVEDKISRVAEAEETIDNLVTGLQEVEEELSFLVHRARTGGLGGQGGEGGSAVRRRQEVNVEDVVAYANHCSFTTSCGVRWFKADNTPVHPPNQMWDPRFFLPFPPEHTMRQEGGLFTFASTRKPVPPQPVEPKDQETAGQVPEKMPVLMETEITEPAAKRLKLDPEKAEESKPAGRNGFDDVGTYSAAQPPPQPAEANDTSTEDLRTFNPAVGSLSDDSEEEDEFEMDLNPSASQTVNGQPAGGSHVDIPPNQAPPVSVKQESDLKQEQTEPGQEGRVAVKAEGDDAGDDDDDDDDEFAEHWDMDLNS